MDQSLKSFLISLSILSAAIIGIIRYKVVDAGYRLFLWYIFFSLFNELLVGIFLSKMAKSTPLID
jgi:hypothetical protein